MKLNSGVFSVCLLLMVAFLPQIGHAEMFENGFKLRAGGFLAYLDSNTSVYSIGTDNSKIIDFESDLGLEESRFSPYFEISYRFNQKHALLLNYLSLHRDGTKESIGNPFELKWNGSTYRIAPGVRLETTLNLDIYQLAYMYNFYSSDKLILAATLGAHIAQIENGYDGEIGLVSNLGVVTTAQQVINKSVTAPLPDIGLLAYYKLDDDIILGVRAQYFQLTVADIEGQVLDLRGECLKYLDKDRHWGIGAAYQYYDVKVDYTGKASTLDVELSYQGPAVFIQYDF